MRRVSVGLLKKPAKQLNAKSKAGCDIVKADFSAPALAAAA